MEPGYQPNLETARATRTEAVNRAVELGEPEGMELPVVTAKGRHIWVRTAGEARFEHGHCAVLYGTFRTSLSTVNKVSAFAVPSSTTVR